MTNLFICKRTLGGSEEGTRYYVYEEVAPVEDLERVSGALKNCITVMDDAGRSAALKELTDEELGKMWLVVVGRAKEAIEILEKMK